MTTLTRHRLTVLSIGIAAWAGTAAWYDSANDLSVMTASYWLPNSPGELLGMALGITYVLVPFAILAAGARSLGWAALPAALACAALMGECTRETLDSTSSLAAVPMMMAPFMAAVPAGLFVVIVRAVRRGDEV